MLDTARKGRKKYEAGHGEKSVIRLYQRTSTAGIREDALSSPVGEEPIHFDERFSEPETSSVEEALKIKLCLRLQIVSQPQVCKAARDFAISFRSSALLRLILL